MCKPVEANVTNLNNTIRLTDELERQLMLQAIEEQFRPHPMRALAAGLRKLAHGIRALVGKASAKDAHSAA
ncbi:hypothetical protein KDH83_17590 [Achromobacter sp. Marseille-Q0513]|jgi:hypothetical protein|uniref:hypothetical protein n=1 Tax=unclassified Achromobacter TaxID=2626865 RepID=UPI0018F83E04|nr:MULTISPECIES: hypothetical protein [unclassified Achromobacter]MBR8655119.1 hypothetical protein [Achromobacter sp. Marseille-Q0513]